MSAAPTFIFAGGGTGGHLYPALAVAAEVTRLEPQAVIVFACSNRDIDRRVLDPTPYSIVPQPIRPLPRGAKDVLPFMRAFLASRKLAKAMVADLKPSAVLGLGGFAAGAVVQQSARAGVRCGLLNPDAVPGKANQYLAGYVQTIFTQFESTTQTFKPAAQAKVQVAGCPVRRELLSGSRAEALEFFDLRPDRLTLTVLGGSLGAASINDAMRALVPDLDELAQTWQVLHVTGPAKSGPDASAQPSSIHWRTLEYCHRMDLAYAASDLAICRGGAVTVAELTATGTPSIILPYPYHADQQQKLNAAQLSAAGAGIVVQDTKDGTTNAAVLRGVMLPLMRDPEQVLEMRMAARGLGKPDAAQDVAKWLLGDGRQ